MSAITPWQWKHIMNSALRHAEERRERLCVVAVKEIFPGTDVTYWRYQICTPATPASIKAQR